MVEKDIQPLIEALGGERVQADAAGRSLLQRGRSILPALVAAWPASPPAVRRRLAFLLGRIAPQELRPERQRVLMDALSDPDRKVRRNAAVSLGRAGDDSVLPRLRDALEKEGDPAVRASLRLACGRFAAAADLPWLASVPAQTEAERRAAHTVADRVAAQAGAAAAVAVDRAIADEARPELWFRRGLAPVVVAEARGRGLAAGAPAEDRLPVKGGPTLGALLEVRTALHPALVCDLTVSSGDPAGAGARFSRSVVAREMGRLTAGGQPVYRITLALPVPGFPRRRDWIEAFTAAAGLPSAATGYSWELIVRPRPGGLLLGARPATAPDHRFDYRERDVPAALHPTLAAAAAQLLDRADTDLVVDPFCGSGTLLVECARAGARRLVGIDHQEAALAAARINLRRAGVQAQLLRADFSQLERFAPIDALVTNPPYGRRNRRPRPGPRSTRGAGCPGGARAAARWSSSGIPPARDRAARGTHRRAAPGPGRRRPRRHFVARPPPVVAYGRVGQRLRVGEVQVRHRTVWTVPVGGGASAGRRTTVR